MCRKKLEIAGAGEKSRGVMVEGEGGGARSRGAGICRRKAVGLRYGARE